jgi:hypothetical protein
VIVVGFVSCYREGRLVRGAIDSALDVELERLYVYEGPAGKPLENELELPASELDSYRDHPADIVIHEGRWRTDARKRNEMLQRARREWCESRGNDEPVWAVTVDADEVLVNGRYLRDRLEWLVANDAGAERRSARRTIRRWRGGRCTSSSTKGQ